MSEVALLPGSRVTVRVPASSANLGPGFDSIGLALGVWDECTVEVLDGPGVDIVVSGEGSDRVPRDERHLVVRVMKRAWSELDVPAPQGLRLQCHNAVPHGRGMGSSATAIVTGIVAAQGLLALAAGSSEVDLGFTNSLAARLEGHPDNSSASVFGGATLSWSDNPEAGTTTVQLPVHPLVNPVVFAPDTELSTAKARSVLPAQVRLGDAAANSGRAALLAHALGHAPEHLVAATRDWLHQEARRPSYAPSMDLVDRLRAAGHAATISGAGPSVLALAVGEEAAADVREFGMPGWRVLEPGIPSTGAHLETSVLT